MSSDGTSSRIIAAIHLAHEKACWVPAPPELREGRIVVRPVPLQRLIEPFYATFDEVDGLTSASAAAYLLRWGIGQPQLLNDLTPLAGFVFANANAAYILVRRDDPLPRRRFTVAHELGHLLLHFSGDDRSTGKGADWAIVDGLENISEAVIGAAEQATINASASLSLPWQEREANRFAAELLMPEEVVRSLYHHYQSRWGSAERFLVGHIAGDLLVSRQAVQYRLADLGLSHAA